MVARHWRSPEVVDEDVREWGAVGGDVGVAQDGLHVVVHKVTLEAVGEWRVVTVHVSRIWIRTECEFQIVIVKTVRLRSSWTPICAWVHCNLLHSFFSLEDYAEQMSNQN